MNSPHTDCSPARYMPNPEDDRRLSGPEAAAYFEIATALDAIGNLYARDEWVANGKPAALAMGLQAQARRAVGQAEHALRRAAWMIVLNADEPAKEEALK